MSNLFKCMLFSGCLFLTMTKAYAAPDVSLNDLRTKVICMSDSNYNVFIATEAVNKEVAKYNGRIVSLSAPSVTSGQNSSVCVTLTYGVLREKSELTTEK